MVSLVDLIIQGQVMGHGTPPTWLQPPSEVTLSISEKAEKLNFELLQNGFRKPDTPNLTEALFFQTFLAVSGVLSLLTRCTLEPLEPCDKLQRNHPIHHGHQTHHITIGI